MNNIISPGTIVILKEISNKDNWFQYRKLLIGKKFEVQSSKQNDDGYLSGMFVYDDPDLDYVISRMYPDSPHYEEGDERFSFSYVKIEDFEDQPMVDRSTLNSLSGARNG